jgi:hypothetical protein
MTCEERTTLQEKYHQEVQAYIQSVYTLSDYTLCDIPHVEWMLLLKVAEYVRIRCGAARRNLQKHCIEHHC